NAHAAAHHNAVDQGNVGLRKMLDRGVEDVFVTIEIERIRRSYLARFVESANIAPRAERTLARTANDNRFDICIDRPSIELRLHFQAHRVRERIERLRPIERDETDCAAPFEEDFVPITHHLLPDTSNISVDTQFAAFQLKSK